MMRTFLYLTLLLCSHLTAQTSLISYINPMIGTGGHGHTFPGATAPFGLVQLSPDTRTDMLDWDACSGYHHSDTMVYGFSHTHLSGTGVADYCDLLFMPYTGGARMEPTEYASAFKKTTEKAEAGYYSVQLEKNKIKCELTATERVGVHRYAYPQSREKGSVLVDLRHRDEVVASQMEVVNDREIAGYRISKAWATNQHIYFVARFSRRISSSIVLDMAQNPRVAERSVTSKSIVGLFDFYNDPEPLVITVGISGVSIEGARRNLESECNHFDFDRVKRETQQKWERQLSKIEVKGGSEDQKTMFYTALYHTMIQPNIWNDTDGQYRGRDQKIHRTDGHDMYSVFSLWDTYRACNPLYTIIEPARTNDFVQTFLRQYEQGGALPVWELAANETDCMIGHHAIPVIADAYSKGIRNYDGSLALKAMMASAMDSQRGGVAYRNNGFISADEEAESVSKSLEYAFDDWCIALMAHAQNNDLVFKTYQSRAQSYKNLFDPGSKFFRARSNGGWYAPFDPFEVNFNYTEANAWQYRFSVPQDVNGMARLLGGRDQYGAALDELFGAKTETKGRNQADITGLIGQYVHGNEPSHHIAYLYNYVGQPSKTQQRVRQIMDNMYHNAPDGLSGNEDCGQMSAWLVLSAMGIYQVAPGDPTYTIGSPWFEKVKINLDNKKSFTIDAPDASAKNCYIKNIMLNGREWGKTWLTHNDIIDGGTLTLGMSDQPSLWGSAPRDCPVSEITSNAVIPVPFVKKGERVFRGEQTIELGCAQPDLPLEYAFVNNQDFVRWIPYTKPFKIQASEKIQARVVGQQTWGQMEAQFSKIEENRKVLKYNTAYNAQYTARGDEGLIDGIRGNKTDFRTGDWQGFEGVDADLVIDLGKKQKINSVTAGLLQDENAWIFFPKQLHVEYSQDGKNYVSVGEINIDVAATEKGVIQKDIMFETKGVKARYIRFVAISPGKCPDWHKGRGFPCWIFLDEILIK